MPRLIWVFPGHKGHFISFVVQWLSFLFSTIFSWLSSVFHYNATDTTQIKFNYKTCKCNAIQSDIETSITNPFISCFLSFFSGFPPVLEAVSSSFFSEIKLGHITRKPVRRDLRPGKTQTGLLSYKNKVEFWNSGCSKYRLYCPSSEQQRHWSDCADLLLFAYGKSRFSHDMAYLIYTFCLLCIIADSHMVLEGRLRNIKSRQPSICLTTPCVNQRLQLNTPVRKNYFYFQHECSIIATFSKGLLCRGHWK